MDGQAIGTAIALIVAAILTAGIALSAFQRRQRREAKRQLALLQRAVQRRDQQLVMGQRWGELAEDWFYKSRAGRRQHNDEWHATDGHGIDMLDIPPELGNGFRAAIYLPDDPDDGED